MVLSSDATSKRVPLRSKQHLQNVTKRLRACSRWHSEQALVGRQGTGVDVQPLLNHADVPYTHAAVGVAGDDCVAPEIERCAIARVAVAVQSLNAEARARVPQRNGLVPAAGADVV